MKPQTKMVLEYIKKRGSITQLDALSHLHCMRLGARVKELRDEGIQIKTSLETGKNGFGEPVRYARYSL